MIDGRYADLLSVDDPEHDEVGYVTDVGAVRRRSGEVSTVVHILQLRVFINDRWYYEIAFGS